MKTNRFALLALICLFPAFVIAQSFTISGYITDFKTGERLIGATVFNTKTHKGTTTNGYGFYSITVKCEDSICMRVSYVGYQSEEHSIKSNKDTTLDVALKSDLVLDEVVVEGERFNLPIHQKVEMSSISIPMSKAKLLPALGGESDVLKAVQLMPGVQSGNEGTSGLYVRGGSPDQNLMILDDAPLYYVNHLGGFVSIFNADAISDINLIKGGFPARYGNRLSSVMDIRMRDGNAKEYHGNAMLGLVAAKAAVEGPIVRDTSSFLCSFRRFMYDLITRPLSRIVFDNVSEGYTFYDLNLKLNYHISSKDVLYLSLYSGSDKIIVNIKDKSSNGSYSDNWAKSWGNQLAALRWNHLFGPRLFSNTTLAYTRYHYQTSEKYQADMNSFNEQFTDRYLSSINDFSIKTDFEFYPTARYKMLFGASSILHTFKPSKEEYSSTADNISICDTTFGDYTLRAWENAAYLENIVQIAESISLNAGLRLSHYAVEDTNYLHLEPRFLFNWQIGNHYSVKASYAKMNQNIHLLTNSGPGMPTDLWMPATKKVAPESSSQYAIGVASEQSIKNHLYSFSLELYYKQMDNLISYKSGAQLQMSSLDWSEKIEKRGKGVSKGVELLAKKETGRTTGWIGCTVSKTTRQFDNINAGSPFLFKYDRPLDLSIVLIHHISDNIHCSLTWVYGTGNAITLPVGAYSIQTEEGVETIFIYEGINTFRMRSYHRLDLGISFEKEKKHGTRIWNVSVYNAYNRKNPYYYYFKTDSQSGEVKLMQVTMFPIMPSVSYEFRF